MASILIYSKAGDGYGLATRLAKESHVVRIFIVDSKAQGVGLGFKNPKTVSSWDAYANSSDLIIFDMCGHGSKADQLAEGGRLVLGGGRVNDKLTLDQDYGQKVAKSLLKVNITDTPDPGIEVTVEGWFNGKTFAEPFNYTIKDKRFMEGDKGPITDGMGCLVWFAKEGDKLVERLLLPLKEFLTEGKYIGPISVDVLATMYDLHFQKFNAGIQNETIQAFSEGIRGKLFEFLYGIAIGTLKDAKVNNRYNIGVRLSLPPWPNETGAENLNGCIPVRVPREAQRHVWLTDVQNDKFEMSGVNGVIGTVTAYGDTINEARRRVYRTVGNISLTRDIQFRQDIGTETESKIKQLETWGYIN